MDSGSSAQDGLFDESLVERVELPTDVPMDANGGVRKRFKAFEPDAVMLVPPSLEEWLPQGHLARFIGTVFGQINTRQGKHVLLRGLKKASAEWKLMAGCHNLLKLFSYRTATA